MDVLQRQTALEELRMFLVDAERSLSSVLSKLGWTKDRLLKRTEEIVSCPFDSGHKMPASSLEKHMETCSWIKEGYTREEKEKALPSSHFAYANSTSVVPVLIDKAIQAQILKDALPPEERIRAISYEHEIEVPHTMDRAIVQFSPQQRLAIYDYVIAKAKATKQLATPTLEELTGTFKKNEEPSKPKSELEIMAEQRDYKRRRQSYRAKNVHITQKSYTEVMREVIQNQMGLLEFLHERNKEENKPSIKIEAKSDCANMQLGSPHFVKEESAHKVDSRFRNNCAKSTESVRKLNDNAKVSRDSSGAEFHKRSRSPSHRKRGHHNSGDEHKDHKRIKNERHKRHKKKHHKHKSKHRKHNKASSSSSDGSSGDN